MKLVRFGARGQEKPGIVKDNNRYDLSAFFQDWDHAFFQGEGLKKLSALLEGAAELPLVDVDARWASCIARPGKVICIGLNYTDHARESGMAIPEEPIIFQKASNTVVGPYDPIIIPRGGEKTDWEVELGVVIGANASYLENEAQAAGCIAGYCVVNDVSERAFQLERGGQWTKGKSCDNFCPTGPWLLSSDEVSDVQNLDLELKVNGTVMQSGNTVNMIFSIRQIVLYLSQFMTLEAGDLILTGTPAGVGFGMNPPVYLQDGDIVELSVTGLGKQEQRCEKR